MVENSTERALIRTFRSMTPEKLSAVELESRRMMQLAVSFRPAKVILDVDMTDDQIVWLLDELKLVRRLRQATAAQREAIFQEHQRLIRRGQVRLLRKKAV